MEEKQEEFYSVPVVDSPTILVFDDMLEFDPAQCSSVKDARTKYTAMIGNLNRCSLYAAYAMGKFIYYLYEDKRSKPFEVPTIEALADEFGVARRTVWRWRTIYDMLTPHQLRQLADRLVSINAVLEIAKYRDKPEEAKRLLDALLSGELKTQKDVEDAAVAKVLERVKPYNLYPAGAPKGVGDDDEDEYDCQQLLIGESELEDEDEPEYEESKAAKAPTTSTKASKSEDYDDDEDDDDEEDTQNKRDIKVIMRNCCASIATINRELTAVMEHIVPQLDVLHDRAAVIMGDEAMFEEYNDALEGVYGNLVSVVEKLVPEVQRGLEHGLLKRQCVLPESTRLDKVFRTEE